MLLTNPFSDEGHGPSGYPPGYSGGLNPLGGGSGPGAGSGLNSMNDPLSTAGSVSLAGGGGSGGGAPRSLSSGLLGPLGSSSSGGGGSGGGGGGSPHGGGKGFGGGGGVGGPSSAASGLFGGSQQDRDAAMASAAVKAAQTPQGQEAVKNMAARGLSRAGSALGSGAGQARDYIQANPTNIRVLSFCGGALLTGVSIFNLITQIVAAFTVVHTFLYVLHFYQALFGIIIMCLDGPEDKIPEMVLNQIFTSLPMLRHNGGRAVFYLFITALQGSLPGWFNFASAIFFLLCTLRFFIAHGANLRNERPAVSPPMMESA